MSDTSPPSNAAPTAAPLPSERQSLAMLALLALAVCTCLLGLHEGPDMGDHECINALAARQSIESGEWVIPRVAEIPWIRKTPLGVWLIGAAAYLVGDPTGPAPVTEFSARLPSALAGIGNALVLAWLGSMLYGRRAGLVAGFISAGCLATVLYSRNAQVDIVLTFFNTLSFACFWRGAMHERPSRPWMAAFYAAFALAMLAKAPLPLATVGLPLAAFWFVTLPLAAPAAGTAMGAAVLGPVSGLRRRVVEWGRQFRRLPNLWLIPGILLFVVLFGAWPLYVYLKVDNALALWRIEYLARFTGELSDKVRPVWYYLPFIFGLTAPFMLSIPEAVAAPFLRRYAGQRRGLAFAFTWAVVATAFLSASAFKRPHYLLSVVPAYCLLLAPVIDRLFFGAVSVAAARVRAACYGLPVILGVGAIAGGFFVHREYPALMKTYVFAVAGAFLAWTAACLTFARNRRTLSFALLNLGVPVVVLMVWPVAGHAANLNAEARALAAALRDHGIGPGDAVFWADKRPNSSVEFYSGVRIQRLINEIEMADIRSGRRAVSREVYEETARRVQQRLSEDRPVYLIMTAGNYGLLTQATGVDAKVVFKLPRLRREADDDLLVFTQNRATTSGP